MRDKGRRAYLAVHANESVEEREDRAFDGGFWVERSGDCSKNEPLSGQGLEWKHKMGFRD